MPPADWFGKIFDISFGRYPKLGADAVQGDPEIERGPAIVDGAADAARAAAGGREAVLHPRQRVPSEPRFSLP